MVAAVIGTTRQRRADRIQDAISYALAKKKHILNGEDVRSVTVTVKFKNGSDAVRCVLVNVEMEDELVE
jgi:hypothetical protein